MNIVKYTSEFSELAKNFKCGNAIIDRFLQSGDALDENQGITYILLSEENNLYKKVTKSVINYISVLMILSNKI